MSFIEQVVNIDDAEDWYLSDEDDPMYSDEEEEEMVENLILVNEEEEEEINGIEQEQEQEQEQEGTERNPWTPEAFDPKIKEFRFYRGISRDKLPMNFPNSPTPLDFFQLFVSDDLLKTLSSYSMEYSKLKIEENYKKAKLKNPNAKKRSPFETNLQMMKTFIGSLIYMGIFQLRKMSDFFRTEAIFENFLQKNISRKQLMDHSRFFYVSSPTAENLEKDPIHKVRFLVNRMSLLFKQFWQPFPKVTVDEAMIKSKSKKSGFLIFMKEKPTKWGIRVWMIVDEKKYVYNYQIYTGKKGNEGKAEKGLGKRVLNDMVSSLPQNRPFRIFADNFFSDVEIVEKLLKECIYYTGDHFFFSKLNRKELKKKKKRYFEKQQKRSQDITWSRFEKRRDSIHSTKWGISPAVV